jgi:hypothetical protein
VCVGGVHIRVVYIFLKSVLYMSVAYHVCVMRMCVVHVCIAYMCVMHVCVLHMCVEHVCDVPVFASKGEEYGLQSGGFSVFQHGVYGLRVRYGVTGRHQL